MLLGETQKDLATAMKEFLSAQNYTVHLEDSGLRILERLRLELFDVIVLEVALPGLDAMSVIRGYRSTGGSTPILLISGKYCSEEFQCALDAGADAYMCKPFRLKDVAAQLRALLRRPALRSGKILTSGLVAVDTVAGTVTRDDIKIHLHPMEFKLLEFLLQHPDQVFNARAIMERVWHKDLEFLDDTVRTHVRTLRQKIDSEGIPSIITTVRGLGYKTENRF
jgi:Response regulators consisting of a CheY-like receiver domain and a winged-helix DNA-binding domain